MIQNKRQVLITVALAYANGDLHIGHLYGYILADIYKRFINFIGHKCIMISGSDMHGTPIMIAAQKQNISPSELSIFFSTRHKQILSILGIDFDYFGNTHTKYHQELLNNCFYKLKIKNIVYSKKIVRPYDDTKKMFLPDRFVIGTCPNCLSPKQYGDSCDACGTVYQAIDLINPLSSLSGFCVNHKETNHYFFSLTSFNDYINKYVDNLDVSVRNFHIEFTKDIKDWDISRDAPYFGFLIPNTDQYYYVWIDAMLGYVSIANNIKKDIWLNNDFEIYQYIGKDIIYFHTVFWPALLSSLDMRLPNSIKVHGFVTVENKKMSKSKGTSISAQECIDKIDPSYLRYFFAKKSRGIQDIDFSFEQVIKESHVLVNQIINIASRSCHFFSNYFDNKVGLLVNKYLDIFNNDVISFEQYILQSYESNQYYQVIQTVEQIARLVNQEINANEPWVQINITDQFNNVHQLCSFAINAFKIKMIYLYPIIPNIAIRAFDILNINPVWDMSLLNDNHKINNFNTIINKINVPK